MRLLRFHMATVVIIVLVVFSAASLAASLALWIRLSKATDPQSAIAAVGQSVQLLELSLSEKFSSARTDMAARLEQTKGDLRQEVADRLTQGFEKIHAGVEEHLAAGRQEQSKDLAAARHELTTSLTNTTAELKREFEGLNQRTEQKLEAIRGQVDLKLGAISEQVQQKLNENLKEGFSQFEKVQQHLKAAEEQL